VDNRSLDPATAARPKLTSVSLLQLQVEDEPIELSLDGVQLALRALTHRPAPLLQDESLQQLE
jgi:hypothetical protein